MGAGFDNVPVFSEVRHLSVVFSLSWFLIIIKAWLFYNLLVLLLLKESASVSHQFLNYSIYLLLTSTKTLTSEHSYIIYLTIYDSFQRAAQKLAQRINVHINNNDALNQTIGATTASSPSSFLAPSAVKRPDNMMTTTSTITSTTSTGITTVIATLTPAETANSVAVNTNLLVTSSSPTYTVECEGGYGGNLVRNGGFCGALQRAPPTMPSALARRLVNKENYGLGKVSKSQMTSVKSWREKWCDGKASASILSKGIISDLKRQDFSLAIKKL